MSPWQPIETAPKDGTTFLAWWPNQFNGKMAFARWNPDQYAKKPRPYWSSCADERIWGTVATRANQPTHWMPLPAAPTLSRESSK